jgi:4-hydroxy-3-methylbut-2-enyl diphosphate reductase IspH
VDRAVAYAYETRHRIPDRCIHRCARDGFTVIIHGKHYHQETWVTASKTLGHPNAHYLCVRDLRESDMVSGYLRGEVTAEALLAQFAEAVSPGFDPARDPQRIGVANQTTMLMTETLAVQEMQRATMRDRNGDTGPEQFRAFDTICSATQDQQDAVSRRHGRITSVDVGNPLISPHRSSLKRAPRGPVRRASGRCGGRVQDGHGVRLSASSRAHVGARRAGRRRCVAR